jgi:hypothetical protein
LETSIAGLAPGQVARLAGRLAGLGGLHDLADHGLRASRGFSSNHSASFSLSSASTAGRTSD